MKYATFWQRFAALWIDCFVLLPLLVAKYFVESFSKSVAMFLVIPMMAVFMGYNIYFHGRFGQTIGKRAMGIRLLRTDGSSVGWREAWLRSSVDIAFAIPIVIGSFVALATITDSEYYGVGWTQRVLNLGSHRPEWSEWVHKASQVWMWSEVVVMLFNRRRRALHDFIAGTVVTSDR